MDKLIDRIRAADAGELTADKEILINRLREFYYESKDNEYEQHKSPTAKQNT